ncbi:MAG: hypothetical protein GY906_04880 [bacterium]|nr:hypothetical protein [bacterium]
MKLTSHQQDLALRLKTGTLLRLGVAGTPEFNGRAMRGATERALGLYFGTELVQVTTKGKHSDQRFLTLRRHVAEINEVAYITGIETARVIRHLPNEQVE